MSQYAFHPEHIKGMLETPWEQAAPAFCVFGNLYFVGNQDGASWLLESLEGLILFDTNYPTADALLVDSIWSLGFDPRNIVAIFHTHGHFDHMGATDLVKGLSHGKTYLGEADAGMFLERPELAMIEDGQYPHLKIFRPDVIVHDGDIFRFGDTCIRAVSCPGHTPGATSYFFNVTDGEQTLTAGLHGGAGLNTLCREYREEQRVDWREDFVQSLAKVYEEPVDIFLGNHTGQNDALGKYARMEREGKNPFIDPNAWKAFLDQVRSRYEQMLKEEGLQK